MSITDLEAFKRQMAAGLEPAERQKLEALEAASLTNLSDAQIERIKRDPKLGSYPTMRLVMAAWNRQENALNRDAMDRKAEIEREARKRI